MRKDPIDQCFDDEENSVVHRCCGVQLNAKCGVIQHQIHLRLKHHVKWFAEVCGTTHLLQAMQPESSLKRQLVGNALTVAVEHQLQQRLHRATDAN